MQNSVCEKRKYTFFVGKINISEFGSRSFTICVVYAENNNVFEDLSIFFAFHVHIEACFPINKQ